MQVLPDPVSARREQAHVVELMLSVLNRCCSPDNRTAVERIVEPDGRDGGPSATECHPGLFALAHNLQDGRVEASVRLGSDTQRRARISCARAKENSCPQWAVDLPPVEDHLRAAVARAVTQAPTADQAVGSPARTTVVPWQERDQRAFCAASCLISRVWPEMLDTMVVVTRQVVLLSEGPIAGFTDFACHGAIFLRRIASESSGTDPLPVDIRLAEGLIHESTHNECNAAAVLAPFLRTGPDVDGRQVATPLRPDPRPLTGLFQQLVVLARGVIWYDKLLSREGRQMEALQSRYAILSSRAWAAARTMHREAAVLDAAGRAILDEVDGLLGGVRNAARP